MKPIAYYERMPTLSRKRACVMFTSPGIGRTIMQEDDGKVDELLRKAICAARKAFWDIYKPAIERKPDAYRGMCENGHEKGQRGCALCEDLV